MKEGLKFVAKFLCVVVVSGVLASVGVKDVHPEDWFC